MLAADPDCRIFKYSRRIVVSRVSGAKIPGPSGQLVDVVTLDFDATEPWATLTLSDGTTIKIRIVIKAVHRLDGEHDVLGNPVYFISSETLLRVVTAGKGLTGEPTIKPMAMMPTAPSPKDQNLSGYS